MTIHDISCILTIMEEMSINKAAGRLYISQPALSKCVKKVEQEYHISLFARSRGSALILTEAGCRFREMGVGILQQHQLFVHQIEQLRNRSENNIVFATTMQRAYDMSGPVMKWIYDHHPGYSMELKTLASREIPEGIISGNIDLAVLPNPEENPRLAFEVVMQTDTYLYLRRGSEASRWAKREEGSPYPVLSMQDMEGEKLVENLPGTGGRKAADLVMKRSGVCLPVVEQPLHSLRVAMVNAGYASMLISGDTVERIQSIDKSRLYCLPREQNVVSRTCLVCRKEFRKDKRFEIILEALEEYYSAREKE